MAKHIWSVLCYKALLDIQTNQVSLIDVMESVTIRGRRRTPEGVEVAMIALSLTLVTLWQRSDMAVVERMRGRAVVIAPDGEVFPGRPMDIDLEAAPRARAFMRLPTLPYKGPGEYRVAVETRRTDDDAWEREASVPLQVSYEEVLVPQLRPAVKDKPKRQAARRAAKR